MSFGNPLNKKPRPRKWKQVEIHRSGQNPGKPELPIWTGCLLVGFFIHHHGGVSLHIVRLDLECGEGTIFSDKKTKKVPLFDGHKTRLELMYPVGPWQWAGVHFLWSLCKSGPLTEKKAKPELDEETSNPPPYPSTRQADQYSWEKLDGFVGLTKDLWVYQFFNCPALVLLVCLTLFFVCGVCGMWGFGDSF